MEIEKLQSYDDVLKHLSQKKRISHLLFGNGFSMAYNPGIFSYNALSSFIEKIDDPALLQLFSRLNTKNFELIMQQLDNFSEIADLFTTDKELVPKIQKVSGKLKNSLIEAVKELHPEYVFSVSEEESKVCSSFLNYYLDNGGNIFSTNYDLLLYWTLMRNNPEKANDGFGRELENDLSDGFVAEEDREYSELRWGKNRAGQNIHYLHGTLPIFDTGIEIIKEEYDGTYLLDKIKERIENKEYPVFVTAGNAQEKLTHIMHNKYLSYCYDRLCNIEGSLVTFGFNFGEYDTHIIDAVNIAAKQGKRVGNKLFSIYVGVYSDEDLKHILELKNKGLFKCKVTPYNARTAKVWR